jgi:hypothetical protein
VTETPMLSNLVWFCLELAMFDLLYLLVAAAERW